MEIITKRSENMSFEEYREHLILQNKYIKNYLKGKLYYLSSEILYHENDINKLFGFRRTYNPFIGSVKNDLTNPINNMSEDIS